MKTFAFALLASLAFAPAARASEAQACDAEAFAVAARFAGFKDFSDEGDDARVAAAVCKAAPDQPGVLLAAFAYSLLPADQRPERYDDLTLATLMIDRAHGRVIASRKEVINEDAGMQVGRSSLTLDTARYTLAPGVRAFGLRLGSIAPGPSCADGYAGGQLTLFVPEGRALRQVLRLDMSTARALSGCIGRNGTERWVVESATLTIALAPTRTQGYADLVVRAKIDASGGDEAKDVPKPRTETQVLHYDGQRYAPPKDSPWWLQDY